MGRAAFMRVPVSEANDLNYLLGSKLNNIGCFIFMNISKYFVNAWIYIARKQWRERCYRLTAQLTRELRSVWIFRMNKIASLLESLGCTSANS